MIMSKMFLGKTSLGVVFLLLHLNELKGFRLDLMYIYHIRNTRFYKPHHLCDSHLLLLLQLLVEIAFIYADRTIVDSGLLGPFPYWISKFCAPLNSSFAAFLNIISPYDGCNWVLLDIIIGNGEVDVFLALPQCSFSVFYTFNCLAWLEV